MIEIEFVPPTLFPLEPGSKVIIRSPGASSWREVPISETRIENGNLRVVLDWDRAREFER